MQLSKNYKTKQKKLVKIPFRYSYWSGNEKKKKKKKFNLKLNNIRKNIMSNNNLNQDKGGHIT